MPHASSKLLPFQRLYQPAFFANMHLFPRRKKEKIPHKCFIFFENLMTSRGEPAEELIACLAEIHCESTWIQLDTSAYLWAKNEHYALWSKVPHTPLRIQNKCSTMRFAMWALLDVAFDISWKSVLAVSFVGLKGASRKTVLDSHSHVSLFLPEAGNAPAL